MLKYSIWPLCKGLKYPDTIIALAEGVSIKQIRVTFDYVDENNNVIPIDKSLPDVEFLPEVINYTDAELDEIEELLEDTWQASKDLLYYLCKQGEKLWLDDRHWLVETKSNQNPKRLVRDRDSIRSMPLRVVIMLGSVIGVRDVKNTLNRGGAEEWPPFLMR